MANFAVIFCSILKKDDLKKICVLPYGDLALLGAEKQPFWNKLFCQMIKSVTCMEAQVSFLRILKGLCLWP